MAWQPEPIGSRPVCINSFWTCCDGRRETIWGELHLISGIGMIAGDGIDALNAWLAKAGLRGEPEAALVSGFCERAVAAGLPISRALVLIDTLHPVYEGRLVRWGHDPSQPVVLEYGRTGLPEGVSDLHLSGGEPPEAVARWRASPFFRMLQTGESLLRRRVTAESEPR